MNVALIVTEAQFKPGQFLCFHLEKALTEEQLLALGIVLLRLKEIHR